MEAEVMAERMEKVFTNSPEDNIQLLPEDMQKHINTAVQDKAKKYASFIQTDMPPEIILSAAIGQAFFAGHEYAVEYGNLNAEMNKEG